MIIGRQGTDAINTVDAELSTAASPAAVQIGGGTSGHLAAFPAICRLSWTSPGVQGRPAFKQALELGEAPRGGSSSAAMAGPQLETSSWRAGSDDDQPVASGASPPPEALGRAEGPGKKTLIAGQKRGGEEHQGQPSSRRRRCAPRRAPPPEADRSWRRRRRAPARLHTQPAHPPHLRTFLFLQSRPGGQRQRRRG